MNIKQIIATTWIVITVVIPLFAHPHIFIKPSIELLLSEKQIHGIKLTWEWDKWWSRDVINGCDKDKNGNLDDKEIPIVFKKYFSTLKDYNYFTDITINKKRHRISAINDFTAVIGNENIVSYIFTVPLSLMITDPLQISVIFNDITIYVAFDKNVTLISPDGYEIYATKIVPMNYYGLHIKYDIVGKK